MLLSWIRYILYLELGLLGRKLKHIRRTVRESFLADFRQRNKVRF